ncbi:MAG: hypothetical protein CMJ18_04275 [Phycisphaeraceae bacterium]|nr:hypothetical protein [Phycisphaeraceae bacterium]
MNETPDRPTGRTSNDRPPRYRVWLRDLSEIAGREELSDPEVDLDGGQAHHLRDVLRLREGDPVEVFDGAGCVGAGRMAGRGGVVLESVRRVAAPVPAIDLAVALPKGPRGDDLVAVASQLGAARLIPLRTQRSTVHPRPTRYARFEKIAVESARQCGRAYLLKVSPTTPFEDVLREGHDLRVMTAPNAARDEIASRLQSARRVLVLVGPEGGWTDDEVDLAGRAGCAALCLGANVLRIETAAAAALAVVAYLATA